MLLVVQDRDVAQVDAGDGQSAAAIEGGERGRNQATDGRKEDGGIERFGRIGVGLTGAGGPEVEGQRPRLRGIG